MNLFVTISFTLLVILAAMFYLLKVKNENHGPAYRWPGLLVVVAACGLLLLLAFKGVKRMVRHDHRDNREMKMHGEAGKCGMNRDEMNCMQDCKDGKMKCCDMDSHHHMRDDEHGRTEISTDTIDGKIIKKEIRIIEK